MARSSYRRTTIGCFVGIFTQAVASNLIPVLFVPMMRLYGLRYEQLGILVAVNFLSQVAVDLLFSKTIDRIGYRRITLPTCAIAAAGLALFTLTPTLFAENIFAGLLVSTLVIATSSGLLEITMSPIVAAAPGADKGPAMSLMHSFYAWGQVVTVLLTSALLLAVGAENWRWIACGWMAVPLTAFALFWGAPMPDVVPAEKRQGMRQLLLRPFLLLCLAAIFAGAATELVMSQWSSTFMENGLGLTKLWGDALGMCGFAALMGVGRTLYGVLGSRLNMAKTCFFCAGLAAACYAITALSPAPWASVAACALCGLGASLLWPGTIVIASERYPLAGAWMFAILAAAGDIGGAAAPSATGLTVERLLGAPLTAAFARLMNLSAEQAALRLGLLCGIVFPLLACACFAALWRAERRAPRGLEARKP